MPVGSAPPWGDATRWIGRSAGDAKATRLRRHYFNIELATGRVRPSADKGLLDPPQQTSQSVSWVRRRVESRSTFANVRGR
jgi:hypothetical protein